MELIRIKEIPTTATFEIFGHKFNGLDDVRRSVGIHVIDRWHGHILRKGPEVEIPGIHILELIKGYPCFDSYDYANEDRSYSNFFFSTHDFTDEMINRLLDIRQSGNYCRIHRDTPLWALPAIYYRGEGSFMELATIALSGKTILYIHGFASSGNSGTAMEIQRLLPDCRVISPDLPVDPFEAFDMLSRIVRDELVDIAVGTSMGGMFANLLRGIPRLLVNPSFHVSESMRKKIGTVKFFKLRADGATEFQVTEALCDRYQDLQSRQFDSLSEEVKRNTFALFGTEDTTVNCKEEYLRHYGDSYKIIPCGHRLTDEAIHRDLIPSIVKLVSDKTVND